MTDLLDTMAGRGFVQDATPGLAERLRAGPITAYAGFDPTADSLHVGNLVPVMGLAWLQREGHVPIALVGGGTGMVGDPSGKRSERPMMDLGQIDRNAQRIGRQLSRFLSFEGANAARLRNNADWLRNIRLMDFLRDNGKHFTVNYMLQKESVQSPGWKPASPSPSSATCWSRPTTSGISSGPRGASCRWAAATSGATSPPGTHLVEKREGLQVHGLVFPLITTATGAKFGKSEAGNVWLDPERTSPYQFYQFWLNTDDRDVERYLKLFTFLRLDRIAATMEKHARDPGKRTAQRVLAREVTATVHGEEAAEQAIQTSEALFGGKATRVGDEVIAEMPERRVSRSQLPAGLQVVDVLVASGLATSKADARRGIQGRGFYLNGEPIESADLVIDDAALQGTADAPFVILRKGRRNYVRLVVEP